MKTLILETSTEKSCLVLSQGEKTIDVLFLTGGPTLSTRLSLDVSLLLEKNSFLPEKLAVGQGPGSFTGIRVGAALAKALAFGWKIPLVGFCSLHAFAPVTEQRFAVLLDARGGGVYMWTPGEKAALLSLSEAAAALRSIPLIASPHPALIQTRLSLPGTWLETGPDPSQLARMAASAIPAPLTFDYLDGEALSASPDFCKILI